MPNELRAWGIIRALYILAVGAYTFTAFTFAGMSLRTLNSPGYTEPPWEAGSLALTEAFAFIAGLLVSSYFLIVAWFARRHGQAAYTQQALRGGVATKSPVDVFNWALYTVIIVYGVLYVVVSLCFGEVH